MLSFTVPTRYSQCFFVKYGNGPIEKGGLGRKRFDGNKEMMSKITDYYRDVTAATNTGHRLTRMPASAKAKSIVDAKGSQNNEWRLFDGCRFTQ